MTHEEAAAANDELIGHYRLTFGHPSGRAVLLDLMKFCHFRVPLPDDDRDMEEGKRRAFLRIVSFMTLEPEALLKLFAGQPIPTGDTND